MLQSTLIYLGSFVGVFIGSGCLFQLIERWNNQFILRSFGKWGIILTGAIGTVIHEGSHALMCLIFGHRIQEIQWFRPFASQWDGRLGYVNHSWNPKNLYQSVGNFFIGIAPLLGGTLVMILLFRWLLPDAYQQMMRSVQPSIYVQSLMKGQWQEIVQQSMKDMGSFFKSLMQSSHLLSWRGVLFLVSVYSISTHMGLSLADLKGSLSGVVILAGLVLGVVCLSRLVGWPGKEILPLIIGYNVRVGLFLCFGLVCSLLTLIISWICSLILA